MTGYNLHYTAILDAMEKEYKSPKPYTIAGNPPIGYPWHMHSNFDHFCNYIETKYPPYPL